jgi:predicted kinase
MKSFKQFTEAKKKEIVFTFGRFNPPTIGHGKLITKVASVAKGNNYHIYASQSNDPKKNPLEYKEKIVAMRKMFPKHGRNIVDNKKAKTVLHIASSLYDQGYTKITMVVGSDRISDFKTLLNKYNGDEGRHGYYDFPDGILVVSAGDRDPDSNDVSGMSASKMRAAAASGDFKAFSNGLPKEYGEDMTLFNLLRKRMGLKEVTNFREHIELKTTTIRERYIAKDVFLVGDKFVNQNDETHSVTERCTNYIVGSDDKKYFLDKITEAKKKLVKSKYTKKFKDMFGESTEEGIRNKAEKTGISYEILKQVFDRGLAAWKKSHRPGTTAVQWAYARINSFATGGKTRTTADADLWKKHKGIKESKDIEEGVDDPAIFKAVFLAGGPGSGKSFTVGKTALTALGFKIVNSDDKFEALLKKAKIEPTPDNIFSPKGQELRKKAKTQTAKQQGLYLEGRLGLVIDGTGKDYTKIKKQSEMLKALGYDVAMIFVNTDMETALKRNKMRSRSLLDKVVQKMWTEVQNNIGKFQSIFKSNFVIVDNSEGSNIEKATTSAYKKMAAFAKGAPQSKIARDWISKQLGEGTGKYKGETWEQGYERRVVKTTDPEHLEKGYKWRIKGKERPEISIKLYKAKPDFKEYSKQMKRVAGHEFGK